MDEVCKGERERQVQLEISRLSDVVSIVAHEIDALLGRLNPALRQEPQCTDEDAPSEVVVELAGSIRSIRYTVESQRDLLQSAIGRLEI